jgi:hypothetical protein
VAKKAEKKADEAAVGKAKWQAERLAKNEENQEAQDAFEPDKKKDGTLNPKERK